MSDHQTDTDENRGVSLALRMGLVFCLAVGRGLMQLGETTSAPHVLLVADLALVAATWWLGGVHRAVLREAGDEVPISAHINALMVLFATFAVWDVWRLVRA